MGDSRAFRKEDIVDAGAADLRLANLFRIGCCLIAALLCLVPALHAAQAHLCCGENASPCCAAASEAPVVESATLLTTQQARPDGNMSGWLAASSDWADPVVPAELPISSTESRKGPPGTAAFVTILRI